MRLIDADAMLKRNEHSIYDTIDLKEMLYYEPTAYDIDKVIEQIKEQDGVCISCRHTDECNECSIGERIKIIKRGGLDG